MMGGGGRALNPSVVLEETAKEKESGIKSVEIFDVRKDGRKLML
jgi:hypothetical protein